MTPLNVLIVINAINSLGNGKPLVVGGLAPASEPNNNGIMLANNVTIQGTLGDLGDLGCLAPMGPWVPGTYGGPWVPGTYGGPWVPGTYRSSGFKRYGANPDGSDLTQASNPAAINWSLLNLATGEVTSTGATGSSQSAPATRGCDRQEQQSGGQGNALYG